MTEPSQSTPPSQHLIALILFLALLPLVYFIPPIYSRYIDHRLGVTFCSVATIVPLMNYLILPGALRAIGRLRRQDP